MARLYLQRSSTGTKLTYNYGYTTEVVLWIVVTGDSDSSDSDGAVATRGSHASRQLIAESSRDSQLTVSR